MTACAAPKSRPRRAPGGGVAVVLAVLGTVLTLALSACGAGRGEGRAVPVAGPERGTSTVGATTPTVARGPAAGAIEVLHTWDGRRSRAWRTGDTAALRRLYVPGSRTGRLDVRLLQEYADHGLVVRRLDTQVFAVRVLEHARDHLRLRVTDRVAGGLARRDGRAVPLPATAPAVRVVELRRTGPGPTGWRVVETSRLR